MRNLMAGEGRVRSNVDGKIPASEALQWLQSRKSFYPSTWRNQRRDRKPQNVFEIGFENEVRFLPVAKDGSVFHRGLKQTDGFHVGARGFEKTFHEFEEALAYLQRLSQPAWRRPSRMGSWTVVSAVRWERVNKNELKIIETRSAHDKTGSGKVK